MPGKFRSWRYSGLGIAGRECRKVAVRFRSFTKVSSHPVPDLSLQTAFPCHTWQEGMPPPFQRRLFPWLPLRISPIAREARPPGFFGQLYPTHLSYSTLLSVVWRQVRQVRRVVWWFLSWTLDACCTPICPDDPGGDCTWYYCKLLNGSPLDVKRWLSLRYVLKG